MKMFPNNLMFARNILGLHKIVSFNSSIKNNSLLNKIYPKYIVKYKEYDDYDGKKAKSIRIFRVQWSIIPYSYYISDNYKQLSILEYKINTDSLEIIYLWVDNVNISSEISNLLIEHVKQSAKLENQNKIKCDIYYTLKNYIKYFEKEGFSIHDEIYGERFPWVKTILYLK
jgi:hypothetical protein